MGHKEWSEIFDCEASLRQFRFSLVVPVVENLPAETNMVNFVRRFHMYQSNWDRALQLLNLSALEPYAARKLHSEDPAEEE